VTAAVAVANKDVEVFGWADTGKFLDDTWLLLPEINGTLWSAETFSMSTYRQAIAKMECFLSALDPQNIFGTYKGAPDEAHMRSLVRQAEQNLNIVREYLGVKVLSIAILEALALSTGGDAPLALFMGDLRQGEHDAARAEDYLPHAAPAPGGGNDEVLLRLFEAGRPSQCSFDMKASPLSLYLYKSLSAGKRKQLLSDARAMFEGQLPPRAFLALVDGGILSSIAKACAMIATTRSEALLALTDGLLESHARTASSGNPS
jgi:hypothetical protein